MSAFNDNSGGALSDGEVFANTIIYSNQPRHIGSFFLPTYTATRSIESDDEVERDDMVLQGPSLYHHCQIINYSEIFESFVINNEETSEKVIYEQMFLPPDELCTGDIVQTSDYRGVGSYYVVWLHKDAHHNHPTINSPKQTIPACDEDAAKALLDGSGNITKKRSGEGVIDGKRFISVYDYGLDDDLIRKIQEIFAKYPHLCRYNQSRASLRDDLYPILGTTHSDLLDEICTINNIKIINAITAVKLASPASGINSTDRDLFSHFNPFEECDEEGNVFNAGEVIDNLKKQSSSFKYPLQRRRDQLAQSVCTHERLSCYLFSHLDEMGYSAPTAVSMARVDQLPQQEHYNRDIDLSLLPPPLDKETAFGRALNELRNKIHNSGREFEPDEEAGNDTDIVDTNDNKSGFLIRDFAFVDEVCEDTIAFRSKAAAVEYCEGSPSLLKTREIFQRHSQNISADVSAITGNSTEERLLKYLKLL